MEKRFIMDDGQMGHRSGFVSMEYAVLSGNRHLSNDGNFKIFVGTPVRGSSDNIELRTIFVSIGGDECGKFSS